MAREAARAVIMRYFTYGVGIIGSIVLARSLGAAGRGAYAYVTTVAATVVSVGNLSIEHALMYEWSRRARRELAGAVLVASALIGLLAVGLASAVFIGAGLDVPVGVEPWMMVLGFVSVPVLMLNQHLNGFLVSGGFIRQLNGSELLMTVVRVTGLSLLATSALLDVGTALWLWALTLPLLPVSRMLVIRSLVGFGRPKVRLLTQMVVRGLKYHIGSLSLALILRVDILLLAALVDVREVGKYALAVTLTELALRAGEASSQVAVRVQISPDEAASARVTARVARLNALIGLLLLCALIAVGPFVIEHVFGPSFGGAEAAVLALAPGIAALGLQRPLGAFIVRQDRPIILSIGMSVGLAANLAINVALIPKWGIVGAGVASSLVYVGLAIWLSAWFVRAAQLPWRTLVPTSTDLTAVLRMARARG